MWIEAQIAFRSYIPEKLEKGQLFLIKRETGKFSYPEIIEYDGRSNPDEWLNEHGYPIKLYIVDPGTDPNTDVEYDLAGPEQIGWLDEGPHTDELRDIELKDINIILRDFDSWVAIEVEETEDGGLIPITINHKVQLRWMDEELYFEEDGDDDEDYYEEEDNNEQD